MVSCMMLLAHSLLLLAALLLVCCLISSCVLLVVTIPFRVQVACHMQGRISRIRPPPLPCSVDSPVEQSYCFGPRSSLCPLLCFVYWFAYPAVLVYTLYVLCSLLFLSLALNNAPCHILILPSGFGSVESDHAITHKYIQFLLLASWSVKKARPLASPVVSEHSYPYPDIGDPSI